MNILKIFSNILFLLLTGIVAGLLSLLLLAVLPIDNLPIQLSLIIESFIEELSKLFLLWFVITNLKTTGNIRYYLSMAIFGGIGFSLLELILLLNNDFYKLGNIFLLTTIIHVITFGLLLLGLSISQKKGKKLSTSLIYFFILAFFIHLCYNLIIVKLT